MSARAPEAIHQLWLSVQGKIPHAILSGIVGDAAHVYGYHCARRDLPASDYSVQLHLDRLGANDCASALDISLPPDLMRTCTRRLLHAADAKDPRLKALREFCGTLDGSVTYPWDLSSNSSEGPGSWDDSHLWHIHLSFYRAYADDARALAPIADVLAGIPLTNPQGDDVSQADVLAALKSDEGQAAIKEAATEAVAAFLKGTDGHQYGLLTVVSQAVRDQLEAYGLKRTAQ